MRLSKERGRHERKGRKVLFLRRVSIQSENCGQNFSQKSPSPLRSEGFLLRIFLLTSSPPSVALSCPSPSWRLWTGFTALRINDSSCGVIISVFSTPLRAEPPSTEFPLLFSLARPRSDAKECRLLSSAPYSRDSPDCAYTYST